MRSSKDHCESLEFAVVRRNEREYMMLYALAWKRSQRPSLLFRHALSLHQYVIRRLPTFIFMDE